MAQSLQGQSGDSALFANAHTDLKGHPNQQARCPKWVREPSPAPCPIADARAARRRSSFWSGAKGSFWRRAAVADQGTGARPNAVPTDSLTVRLTTDPF